MKRDQIARTLRGAAPLAENIGHVVESQTVGGFRQALHQSKKPVKRRLAHLPHTFPLCANLRPKLSEGESNFSS